MVTNRRILREWEALVPDRGFIVESREQNNGRLFLRGPMQRAEAPNQNKRIYPRSLLRREFENYQKQVREGRATGELDHPETSTVSLEKVSHVVREMGWEGDTWVGRIEVLPTPCGKIAETLIESGITLGISSRGVGSTSTNESGLDMVQDDFTLVTFDLVQEPSTHGAFMTLGESVDRSGGPVLSRADRINRVLNDIRSRK
jgi:hypothetical protein